MHAHDGFWLLVTAVLLLASAYLITVRGDDAPQKGDRQ